MVGEQLFRDESRSGDDEPLRALLARKEREAAALRREVEHAQRVALAGRLALGLVHDLKTALACVINFNELAGRTPAEESRRCRDEIDRTSKRACGLTQQLLSLGRKREAEPEQIDLDSRLEELRGTLHRLFPAAVTTRLAFASRAEVRIDPVQLAQIVLNLAINALDAMDENGEFSIATTVVDLERTAAARLRVEPGRYAEIEVRDTGSGIPAEALERIFEPFYTTKTSERGTGLGLTLVHRLVTANGGAIGVESEVGRGSTFRVLLPCSARAEQLDRGERRRDRDDQPGQGDQ